MTKQLFIFSLIFIGFCFPNFCNGQSWNEFIKGVASDRSGFDCFGYTVAIDGNRAVVGVGLDDQDENGLNPLTNAGSAYIFTYDGTTWTEEQKIVASDREANDWFGWSVDISGDILIVGSYYEDHDENGSDPLTDAGSAYIFTYDGSNWTEQQKIVASDRESEDYFGYAVAIDSSKVIVGAYLEDEDENGSNPLTDAGSAYIFTYDGSNWTEQQKIVASDRESEDHFGISVDLSGEHAIIGANQEDHDATGNNFLDRSGAAYMFNINGSSWSEKDKLVASDRGAADLFGYSVSIDGDRAIVGAYQEDEDALGNNTISNSGSAYIYNYNGSNWIEQQKIVASDRHSSDIFGMSVDISGNRAIIGAEFNDYDIEGLNYASNAGAAYLFYFNGSQWKQREKIVSADREEDDRFGYDVALSNELAIVGAPYEDHDESGNNTISYAGSAYFFRYAKRIPGGNTLAQPFDSAGVAVQFSTGNSAEIQLAVHGFEEKPNIVGSLPTGVTNIAPHYWSANVDSGTVDGTYDITFDLSKIPGIGDCSNLKVLKRDNSSSSWVDVTSIPGASMDTNPCPDSLRVLGLTIFSDFVIASNGGDNPLPVELTYFSGASVTSGIKLKWTTQSETDNAGFILLRDQNEIASFENTVNLKGQGTTGQSHIYGYTDKDVTLNETYTYQLISVDYSGVRHSYPLTVVITAEEVIDNTGNVFDYALRQNYPNPFNPGTTISFTMKKAGQATLKVYDMLGRSVFEKQIEAKVGENTYTLNAKNLSSGAYFYQLFTDRFSKTMKMMLMK